MHVLKQTENPEKTCHIVVVDIVVVVVTQARFCRLGSQLGVVFKS